MLRNRILAIGAMVLLTLGMTASPAYADNDTVYTNDYPFPWAGHTQWWGNGDRFEVCDTEGNGKRVVGGFDYRPPGSSVWSVGPTRTASGSGNCAGGSRDIPENSVVRIWVCSQDGASGSYHECDSQETRADNS